MRTETIACCAFGRGPAGMPAGPVPASAGVDVSVLEEHQHCADVATREAAGGRR